MTGKILSEGEIGVPAWAGDREQCPHCLRPLATDADETLFNDRIDNERQLPIEWGDNDGEHLCWREAVTGAECSHPDWFEAVTPLDVLKLRERVEAVEQVCVSWEVHAEATGIQGFYDSAQEIRAAIDTELAKAPEEPVCSWCGKSRAEVNALVLAPRAAICDACVGLAVESLRDVKGQP